MGFVSVYDDLARELQADPAKRQALRALLLTEELLELPSTIAALAAEVKELARMMRQAMLRLDHLEPDVGVLKADVSVLKADVSVLKADVSVLKADVSVLKADVSVLKADVSVLKADVGVLKIDMGGLKGSDLERRWQRNLPSYLGRHFRRLQVVEPADLRALLEDAVDLGQITDDEADDAALADVVARGRRPQDASEVYVAVEVSVVVDAHHLDRALRRAEILSRVTDGVVQAVAAGDLATRGAVARQSDTQPVLLVVASREAA